MSPVDPLPRRNVRRFSFFFFAFAFAARGRVAVRRRATEGRHNETVRREKDCVSRYFRTFFPPPSPYVFFFLLLLSTGLKRFTVAFRNTLYTNPALPSPRFLVFTTTSPDVGDKSTRTRTYARRRYYRRVRCACSCTTSRAARPSAARTVRLLFPRVEFNYKSPETAAPPPSSRKSIEI